MKKTELFLEWIALVSIFAQEVKPIIRNNKGQMLADKVTLFGHNLIQELEKPDDNN